MTFISADDRRKVEYHADGLGTKICLSVPDLDRIAELSFKAKDLGLPHFLVEDTGRNTTFNGIPTISALGIGPLYPEESAFLKRLPLYP